MPMSGDRGKRRCDIVAETRRVRSLAGKWAIVVEASAPGVNASARDHARGASGRAREKQQGATPTPYQRR